MIILTALDVFQMLSRIAAANEMGDCTAWEVSLVEAAAWVMMI